MQYLLMIIADESKPVPPTAELSELMRAYREFTESIAASGHLRGGAALQPSPSATTVREQGGRRLVSDGPFAGGQRHLAGYFLVECRHLDEAIAIAGRVPGLRLGEAVEVRPLAPLPEEAGAALPRAS